MRKRRWYAGRSSRPPGACSSERRRGRSCSATCAGTWACPTCSIVFRLSPGRAHPELSCTLLSARCHCPCGVQSDDTLPIIRQDGQYTLAITPRPVLCRVDGQPQQMTVLGVPYGSLPRLVSDPHHDRGRAYPVTPHRPRHLVHRLDEAHGVSHGELRAARLGDAHSPAVGPASCLRVDDPLGQQTVQGDQEFAVKEVKLTNDYAG